MQKFCLPWSSSSGNYREALPVKCPPLVLRLLGYIYLLHEKINNKNNLLDFWLVYKLHLTAYIFLMNLILEFRGENLSGSKIKHLMFLKEEEIFNKLNFHLVRSFLVLECGNAVWAVLKSKIASENSSYSSMVLLRNTLS